ncbi:MAG: PocR ligand-binding domain-containing protein [Candidatus Omnitrophota bacterium]
MEQKLQFKDIISISKWQKIQGHFSEILGVTLRTIDKNGAFLTKTSGSTRLCEEIVRPTPRGITECGHCLPKGTADPETDWQEGYNCPITELKSYSIPLKIENERVGFIILGPALVGKSRERHPYKEIAKKINIEPEAVFDALTEIRAFSYSRILSAVSLLNDIGQYICEVPHLRLKFKNQHPEADSMPQIIQRVHNYYTERVLDSLLNISTKLTDAERGSIMLIDKGTDEIYVKMSMGLSSGIIERSRSKIGEGLAGVAARERKSFFIDKKPAASRIRKYLKIPRLRSSMVMPIVVKDEVLGVLSIGTSDADSQKFTAKSAETVKRMIDLVEGILVRGHPKTDLNEIIS